MTTSFRSAAIASFCALALGAPERAPAQDSSGETVIEMQTLGGLRFDPPRFAVAPGAKVKVLIENADDMAHNFVLTAPDARAEIVAAATAMAGQPNTNYIPKSEKILQHSPMLLPGQSATVTFTAPEKEGVYPYVCTYPAHGQIMYGAMYVKKKPRDPLPPLAKDMNMPETVRELGEVKKLHAYQLTPPYHYRIFMRDAGPAAIGVALPGGQNYCWDAGSCRLRYVWSGGFVDPMPHWVMNGDGYAEVLGRIYYRAPAGFPLRFGAVNNVPEVKFLGYRLVQRYPEFCYTVDGVEVREMIKPQHHGGIETTFTIAKAAAPVFYMVDPAGGATFTSNVGAFKDGVLALAPAQARSFTVKLTEIPGREPLRYWSMNDTFSGRKWPVVDGGVKGRAVMFDGVKHQGDTGLKTDALTSGATFAVWAKAAEQKKKDAKQAAVEASPDPVLRDQVVIGAVAGADEFSLGWNLGDAAGFGLLANVGGKSARIATGQPTDFAWHHLAVTVGPAGFTFYLDGRAVGTTSGRLPAGAPIFFGSAGGAKFTGVTLDEARIDDRVFTPAEIAALHQKERPESSAHPSASQ